jgi:hypothetical protein
MKTFFEYLENGNRVVVLRESMEIYDGLLEMIEENNYSDESFDIFADWLESIGRSLDARFVRFIIGNNEINHPADGDRKTLARIGLTRIRFELGNKSMRYYDKSHINHNFFNIGINYRFDFQAIPFYDLIDILGHAGVGRFNISFDAAKFLVTWRVMEPYQIISLMMYIKDLRQREQLLPFILEKYPHLSNHVRNNLHYLVRTRVGMLYGLDSLA